MQIRSVPMILAWKSPLPQIDAQLMAVLAQIINVGVLAHMIGSCSASLIAGVKFLHIRATVAGSTDVDLVYNRSLQLQVCLCLAFSVEAEEHLFSSMC